MPAFVHDAAFTFDYDSADHARTVERSVRQELGEIDGDRSTATVARDGRSVTVTVEAADPVALRAGINTWLSLVDVAERVSAGPS